MKDFAKKILADVPKEEEFVLHHKGLRNIKNILDLRSELESMDLEEFEKHVNDKKNDFAKWIEHSVGDEKLAKEVNELDSKEEIISILNNRIDFAVSVVEAENEKIINQELTRLKKLEKNKPELSRDIGLLEKDLRKLEKNVNYEEKIIESDDDIIFKKWHEINPIPANARIAEFIFGMVTGLILGLIIARFILG